MATRRSAAARLGARSIDASSAGARPAIVAAAGTSRSASRPSPSRGPQRPTMRRSIRDRPLGLDQLPDHGRGQRLPGPGPAAAGGSAACGAAAARPGGRGGSGGGSRRGRRRRRARSASARSPAPAGPGPAGAGSASGPATAALTAAGIDRLGPQQDPVGPGLPGPHQDRAALDVEQPRRDPPLDPQRPVVAPPRQPVGRRRPHLDLERRACADGPDSHDMRGFAAHRPAASGRAGGRRRGRSGWRRRWPGGSRRRPRRRGERELGADGADGPHRGDGRGAGEDATGGGDRRGADLAAQHRQRRLLIGQRQRPHRVGRRRAARRLPRPRSRRLARARSPPRL